MKKNVLWMILYLVFLIIFNIAFYMLGGTEHPMPVWISYIFIHVAYLLLVVTPFLVRKGSQQALFGRVLTSISAGYFMVEFVVGLIFILFVKNSVKITLLVQLLIMAVYVIFLVVNMLANEYTADSVERHEAELKYVKESAASIQSILAMVKDKSTVKQIEKAYDIVSASPAKSNRNVADIEYQVMSEIGRLRSLVSAGNNDSAKECAEKICSLANERNRRLKISQ